MGLQNYFKVTPLWFWNHALSKPLGYANEGMIPAPAFGPAGVGRWEGAYKKAGGWEGEHQSSFPFLARSFLVGTEQPVRPQRPCFLSWHFPSRQGRQGGRCPGRAVSLARGAEPGLCLGGPSPGACGSFPLTSPAPVSNPGCS